jgi:hypothetical protein
MKAKVKRRHRPLNLLEKAIRIEQLPERVSRPLAAKFGHVTTRTFRRAELKGQLELIRRNSRVVGYKKANLLAFFSLKAK